MKFNPSEYFTESGHLILSSKEVEKLTQEQYLKLVEYQSQAGLDAKDFGPYWLENLQGSLAEERRKSKSNKVKLYNRQVLKARNFSKKLPLRLKDYISNPDSLNIKLSELWARYPTLDISYDFSIQKLTKSNSRLLRGFVIWYYLQEDLNSFIKYEVEEQLDQLLLKDNFPKNEKVLKEIFIIRKLFLILEKELAIHILYSLYKESNLIRWYKTTQTLIEEYDVVNIRFANVKEKVRRRGYRESHSNKRISKDQRGVVAMSNEARELEEIKQRIRQKQAILFERRLDAFLAMEDSNISLTQRREIFNRLLDPIEVSNDINPFQEENPGGEN